MLPQKEFPGSLESYIDMILESVNILLVGEVVRRQWFELITMLVHRVRRCPECHKSSDETLAFTPVIKIDMEDHEGKKIEHIQEGYRNFERQIGVWTKCICSECSYSGAEFQHKVGLWPSILLIKYQRFPNEAERQIDNQVSGAKKIKRGKDVYNLVSVVRHTGSTLHEGVIQTDVLVHLGPGEYSIWRTQDSAKPVVISREQLDEAILNGHIFVYELQEDEVQISTQQM